MNVVFISISSMPDVRQHEISLDLLREFTKNGHNVFIVCSCDGKNHIETQYTDEYGFRVLRVRIGKNKKANLIEKGLTQLLLPRNYIAAIKKFFDNVKFDLILYPTPPVTHVKTVKYLKKRDNAKSYLLLKDIFPQNAVDIGMMSKTGIKWMIYKYFREQEKDLYALSDYIGCMSQANVDYVIKHNPEVDPSIVEVCPNSIEPIDMSVDEVTRVEIRKKYGMPVDKKVFVYGGNLGKPQGIDFFIKCLESQKNNEKVYFLIVGDGTEYGKLEAFVNGANQNNLKLMKRLPKEEYDSMIGACDVGMIFLDYRFTIPNFPSRLLSYMQAKIPVLACTDPNTDIGKVIVEGGFGWWCESNDVNGFNQKIYSVLNAGIPNVKEIEDRYLNEKYDVKIAYETIMNHMAK
jgi:glycosyltransferase involved in cell wall biosynthesis